MPKAPELTPEQREVALAICKRVEYAKAGLCERDWPLYRHKKTKNTVKVKGTNTTAWCPTVYVAATVKAPGARHIRTAQVTALNFERDYELLPTN